MPRQDVSAALRRSFFEKDCTRLPATTGTAAAKATAAETTKSATPKAAASAAAKSASGWKDHGATKAAVSPA